MAKTTLNALIILGFFAAAHAQSDALKSASFQNIHDVTFRFNSDFYPNNGGTNAEQIKHMIQVDAYGGGDLHATFELFFGGGSEQTIITKTPNSNFYRIKSWFPIEEYTRITDLLRTWDRVEIGFGYPNTQHQKSYITISKRLD
ncbi:MAG: hypothetical protein CMH48_07740 [Muricauda sp.]|nr:hypothetical protein [Allomuricauda sp.]MBC30724.1 hypothetical protein [Allomuricauda sp.]|tara:strand:- start:72206 stop:72637 length:432 start_codon:yes stop_codon:yes gene_type:complete